MEEGWAGERPPSLIMQCPDQELKPCNGVDLEPRPFHPGNIRVLALWPHRVSVHLASQEHLGPEPDAGLRSTSFTCSSLSR